MLFICKFFRRLSHSAFLSAEQLAIQQLSRDFAQNEIIPKAAHHDVTGEYPSEIIRKAWDVGLMNLHVPKKYGGSEMGLFESCLISEELAYGCTGIQTVIEANNLAVTKENHNFIRKLH